MARLTSESEITNLKKSGVILSNALQAAARAVKPGVTTGELNTIAEDSIRQQGGQPAFLGYQNYPATLCVSVNHEVVHGIPDPKRKLKSGDVVGLDLGAVYQGIYTDHAITVGVGKIDADAKRLILDTREALAVGLKAVRAGATTGDIGHAIQSFLEPKGYGIVRQLTGHGLGKAVHEAPSIPNFGEPGTGTKLTAGMVLAIEPMVTLGDWHVETQSDGWTVVTADDSRAAHFEDTVLVTDNGYELITPHGKNSRD